MSEGRRGSAGRPGFLRLAFTLAVGLALLAGDVSQGLAQQRERPGGLFNFLFGEPLPRRDGRPPRRVPRGGERFDGYDPENRFGGSERARRPERAERPRARRTRPIVPAEPQVTIVEKAVDAKPVLVVGDFIGGGLAEGLEEAFSETPGVRVVARTNGSSGFVREDVFDWPERIGAIVAEEKPHAVIVMLGSNDRQQMKVDGERQPKLSAAWTAEYEKRAAELGAALKATGVPFLWVGMPSFRPSTMTADMLAFNDLYREAAEAAGGEFVDVWEGFVDEAGAFVATGPDIAGQPVRLRSSDGINLTRAGKRKLAFYIEKPLNRILGGTGAPAVAALPGAEPAVIEKPLDINDIKRTAPVSLADPDLDGAVDLLGGDAAQPPNPTRTAIERLTIEGVAGNAQPGRADDFTAGRPAAVATTPPSPPPDPLSTTTAIRR